MGPPPGVPWGLILGLNHGMFSKLNGPGPLESEGYPHTSFNSGKFLDTYKSFHIELKATSEKLDAPVSLNYIA